MVAMPRRSSGYRIDVEPIAGKVIARRGETVLASSDAAKLMRETRLPPTIYFPRDDVHAITGGRTDNRSFCPFKGTATYWDLRVGSDRIANGAWSYETALPESRAIEGYIGFMPGIVDEYYAEEGLPPQGDDGHIQGALIDWLMRKAWLCQDPVELTRQLGNRLVSDGIPVSRLNVTIWSLHPQIAGRAYVWRRDSDDVRVDSARHENLMNEEFVNSPVRYVSDGMGGVRQPLTGPFADGKLEFSFPIMSELREEGATDYVAMPLPFSDGQINVLTLASDNPSGFSTANLGLIFECTAVISRFYEVLAQRTNAGVLLETYLGKRTGARVLGGEIRRGDGEDIKAAILFCDLRHSSRLAGSLPRKAYLTVLNGFFETVDGIVREHDGEVLKFIGDAVLAIFPTSAGREVCADALAAARAIENAVSDMEVPGAGEHLACAIGASFGRVTYGNVGSTDRLDFTVIGSAANVAARLADLGKAIGHSILVTGAVADGSTGGLQPLGAHQLHNVAGPVDVFAPPVSEVQQVGDQQPRVG